MTIKEHARRRLVWFSYSQFKARKNAVLEVSSNLYSIQCVWAGGKIFQTIRGGGGFGGEDIPDICVGVGWVWGGRCGARTHKPLYLPSSNVLVKGAEDARSHAVKHVQL